MRHSLFVRFSFTLGLPVVLSFILSTTPLLLPGPVRAQAHSTQRMPGMMPDRIGFGPGRYVLADDLPMLTDNNYSIPHVCDWNGDGKKDLMVGVFFEGNVYLFLNQGTDESPVFGEGTLLAADGEPISVGYG